MKTVKRGQEVKRVSDAAAAKAVKDGWSYCQKAEWKVLRIRSATPPPCLNANKPENYSEVDP
jgi:hypothetical protein